MTRARSDLVPGRVQAVLAGCGLLSGRLVVGLSGGVDSVTLLHVTVGLRAVHGCELRAVHVHHGISPNADAWAAACAQLCEQLTVPLSTVKVQVRRARGESLEAAARAARYEVFRAQDAEAVLLAHQADDQVETVLLQLLRGAGALGLAGMQLERMLNPKAGLRLVRPLLRCSRSDIERYARARQLSWLEDESNLDLDFDRNFLRRAVLPRLTERYPGCRETLSRAAENLGEAQRLLDQLAQTDAAQAVLQDRLSLTGLRALEPTRQRNLLRWFLRANGVAPPPRERLASALRQFLESRPDAQPHIELDQCSLRRYRGWLLVERAERNLMQRWALTWNGESSLALPDGTNLKFIAVEGAGLSRARLSAGQVTVRTRDGGERLRVAANRPTRTLKNLLQEAGVPAWQRASLPLLFVGDALAWAAAAGHDCRFSAQPGEPGVLVEWTGHCPMPDVG